MRCPICKKSGTLKHQDMYQYALENKILQNGTISKSKSKKVNIGSEDWSSIYCTNCGAFWSSEDLTTGFYIKDNHIRFDDEEQDRIAYT